MVLPAGNLKSQPVEVVEELASVGSTEPAVVNAAVRVVTLVVVLHPQVMDHVHPVNTGTALLV